MPFNFEGKEMYPIFFHTNFFFFLVNSLQSGKNVHSKQIKTISTQTLQFHVKFICMPC